MAHFPTPKFIAHVQTQTLMRGNTPTIPINLNASDNARPPVWWHSVIAVSVIILAVGSVYSRILDQSWVTWDDNLHVTENPHLNPLSWKGVRQFWVAPYENLYIPVSYMVFSLETFISDVVAPGRMGDARSPLIFKSGNLMLHGLCCLLVLQLFRMWLGTWGPSLLGALLFAWHPLQVESVAWISETRGLLSSVWSLMALYAYCRSVRVEISDVPNVGGRRSNATTSNLWYSVATLCFLMGLLSKPSAVSVVLMAAVIDTFFYGRGTRRISLALFPWLFLAVCDWAITKSLQSGQESGGLISFWLRPVIAGDAVYFYLQKLVWPVGLTIDYGRTPMVCLASPVNYLTALVPVVLGCALLLRAIPLLIKVSVLLFLAGLCPVIGFVPFAFQEISTVADRYVYLAMLGPALLVAWAVQVSNRLQVRMLVGLGLLPLAWIAWLQAGLWRDSQTLYDHALRQNPRSWIVLNNQGALLERDGQIEPALQKFRQALALKSTYARAAYNVGVCYRTLGQVAEAEVWFALAARLWPAEAQFQEALAQSHAKQGDLSQAEADYQNALTTDPANVRLLNQLATLLSDQRRWSEARPFYERAIQADPEFWPARVNFGLMLLKQGELDAAESHLLRAMKGIPDQAEVYFGLGLIAAQRQNLELALSRLESARRLATEEKLQAAIHQELVLVYNARGIQLREQGDVAASVKQFEQAVELDQRFAGGHFNLALSLLHLGNRQAARKHFEQAAALVPSDSPAAVDIKSELQKLKSSDRSADEP